MYRTFLKQITSQVSKETRRDAQEQTEILIKIEKNVLILVSLRVIAKSRRKLSDDNIVSSSTTN